MTTTLGICGVFFANVCSTDPDRPGPTGELVFVDRAMLVDYGGNRIAGPFSSVPRALAAQRKFRGPSQFVPAPGSVRRIAGEHPDHHPDFPSVDCGYVGEDEVK